ncbi:MAG: phage Gp37/Gp68 family protein [Bacteriovoracales bacterium]|nr:phage Gp37/Gp68 family protein [Bacteriovoracales bacterium]
MSTTSSIEWTQATWNPLTGCNKISRGCKNCYAERMSNRLYKMGQYNYRNAFRLTIHDHALSIPLKWKKPRVIFVNSMSDLFHKDVPLSFIKKVFEIMNECPQHQFQILTKRAKRLEEVSDKVIWTNNIWMGVSVEDKNYKNRIDHLLNTKAQVKFLSLEPLIGPLSRLKLKGIDWVIVGGESGPNARPMKSGWVTNIKNQCVKKGVPFFFKQWGGIRKHKTGRLLEGRTWDEMPSFFMG